MSLLRTLIPSPLRPIAREVRRVLRNFQSFPVDTVIPAQELRAGIQPRNAVFVLERRAAINCPILLQNPSKTIWSSEGRYPIVLTLRWLTPRKEPLDHPIAKLPLPEVLFPGQEALVHAALTAPDALGQYLVEVDLVQDGTGPAAPRKPILLDVQVTGRDSEDIDYHKVYATADLEQDYWTVVGPKTKEDYERQSRNTMITLHQNGLTPASRVLDVGCGTGLLARPLETFLSDQGCYYGTDLGEEAIAYCKRKFTRGNFEFAQNEMTSLPIHDREFDMAVFFSVFTHTFPDETALLLTEAKRLLAKDGVIIGDVFLSPMVERCSGNRGMMELNKEHFMRLVQWSGLKAELLADLDWQRYSRRMVYRFTRA